MDEEEKDEQALDSGIPLNDDAFDDDDLEEEDGPLDDSELDEEETF